MLVLVLIHALTFGLIDGCILGHVRVLVIVLVLVIVCPCAYPRN